MKLFPLFALIGTCFLLMIVEGQALTNCERLLNNADCSFYTDCVEANMPCGPSGYAVGYGYHFCNAFGQYNSQFTPEGQEWIRNVRSCLLKEINSLYRNNADCQQIRDGAFNSHPDCYVNNGFCTVILHSWTNLHALVDVLKTNVSALLSKEGVKQVWSTLYRCRAYGHGKEVDSAQCFLESELPTALV